MFLILSPKAALPMFKYDPHALKKGFYGKSERFILNMKAFFNP
jgi:hypothetical protein